MANQLPEDRSDEQDEPKESGNRSRGNALIEYTMKPLVDAAVFSVQKIAPEVTAFLGEVETFEAENGIRIKNGFAFNEWKQSQNLIYLNARVIDRPDITRFPNKGRKIRDNQIAMFNSAMKDLVDTVKMHYKGPIIEAQQKEDGKIRLS